MKRIEQLIDMTRYLSGNTRHDSDSGTPQKVFVQYLNNAQDSLSKEVVNLKTKFLKKTEIVPVVSGQETYAYPTDCYIQHVDTLSWLPTANAEPVPLNKCTSKEKLSSMNGYPFGYILENDGIHLNPPISNGFLKDTYIKQVPRLQKKAGIITVATQVAGQLTALSVATTGTYDATEIDDDYFLCVVNKHGNQVAKNIEYTSQTAGVFTLNPYTLASGETISVGDYIVIGKNCTNLPEWPDVCESYLIKHAVYDAKYSDGSAWSQEAKDDMKSCFQSLSGSFATLSDDVCDIPITTTDYL